METLESLGYEVAQASSNGKWYWRNFKNGTGSIIEFDLYFQAWENIERTVNK